MIARMNRTPLRFVGAVALALALGLPSRTAAAEADTAPTKPAGTKIEHVDAAGAAKLIAAQKVIVLDVRTPAEFEDGHIQGAKNLDFLASDFERQLAELDRDKTYLVHCASGRRSTNSLATFKQLGFKHVVHLDGGFRAWQKAGQPVVK
jgi:rhodanese-related sulfurtransferase